MQELIANKLIEVDANNMLNIKFLAEQLSGFINLSDARAEAGRKGGSNNRSNSVERVKSGMQIYILYCNVDKEEFIKIGSTQNSLSRRYFGEINERYEIIFQYFTENYIEMENILCDLLRDFSYTPKTLLFGKKECFNINCLESIKANLKNCFSIDLAINIQSNANKRRGEKRRKEKIFTAPNLEEVKNYFNENGYLPEAGEKAFNYYDAAQWHDSSGKPVLSWKQKMQAVWFKPENKKQGSILAR